jgi:hypothetical protein
LHSELQLHIFNANQKAAWTIAPENVSVMIPDNLSSSFVCSKVTHFVYLSTSIFFCTIRLATRQIEHVLQSLKPVIAPWKLYGNMTKRKLLDHDKYALL